MRKKTFKKTTLILMVIMVGISFDSCKKPQVQQNEMTFMGKTYPIEKGLISKTDLNSFFVILHNSGISVEKSTKIATGKGHAIAVLVNGMWKKEIGEGTYEFNTKHQNYTFNNGIVVVGVGEADTIYGLTFPDTKGTVTIKKSGSGYEIDFDFNVLIPNRNEESVKLHYKGDMEVFDNAAVVPPAVENPQNYEEISIDYIKKKESDLSSASIDATSDGGSILKAGDVIIYKTNAERYGKFKIVSLDGPAVVPNAKLIIAGTTYNADGSIYKSTNNITIRTTVACDLDELLLSSERSKCDFYWQIPAAGNNSKITPWNTAKLLKVNFR